MMTTDPSFDPVLLRTFLEVVHAGSFTAAARRMDLRQSTVSQHIGRLEANVGRTLLARNTHRMSLTGDGRAMVEFAEAILEAHGRARRHFSETGANGELRGTVRIGVPGEFALVVLPGVLEDFRQRYPLVDVDIRVVRSVQALKDLKIRELDLVVLKQPSDKRRGRLILRERLSWIARDPQLVRADAPVPLVVLDPPSSTRSMALSCLEQAGRAWRISSTSTSFNSLHAALMAGLGVSLQPKSMLLPGLSPLKEVLNLPPPGFVDYTLVSRPGGSSRAAKLLGATIIQAGGGLSIRSDTETKPFASSREIRRA